MSSDDYERARANGFRARLVNEWAKKGRAEAKARREADAARLAELAKRLALFKLPETEDQQERLLPELDDVKWRPEERRLFE